MRRSGRAKLTSPTKDGKQGNTENKGQPAQPKKLSTKKKNPPIVIVSKGSARAEKENKMLNQDLLRIDNTFELDEEELLRGIWQMDNYKNDTAKKEYWEMLLTETVWSLAMKYHQEPTTITAMIEKAFAIVEENRNK